MPVLDSPVARCQLGGVWSPWPCTRPQHRWARTWTSIACRSPLDNAPGAPPRRFGGFLRICIVPATLRYTPVCYHGSPWCARGSLACSRGRSLPGMAPRGGVGGAVTHAPVAAREVVAVARAALVDYGAAGRTVDTQAGGHGQRCWRMRMVLARTWTRSSPGASGRREAWIPPTVVYGRRWAHLGWARGLGRGGCSSASRRQPRAGRAHARAPPPSRRPAAALWTRPTSTRMVVALWRGEGAGPLVLRRVPPSRPPAVRCAWLWLPTASPINTARTVDRAVNTETKARGGDWAIPRGWGVPAPTGASRGMAGVEYHTRGAPLYAWAVGGAAMAAVLPHRARAPKVRPAHRPRGAREGPAGGARPGVAATTVAVGTRHTPHRAGPASVPGAPRRAPRPPRTSGREAPRCTPRRAAVDRRWQRCERQDDGRALQASGWRGAAPRVGPPISCCGWGRGAAPRDGARPAGGAPPAAV